MEGSPQPSPETQAAKRGKPLHKTVVTVKAVAASCGKHKNEGPPADSWSWRKYGQKPIKGSPHPRGYYRCSTSKGCSAKKQVERSRTDASMLIVTYTSTHNHPGPNLTTQNREEIEEPSTVEIGAEPKVELPAAADEQRQNNAENFNLMEPPQDVTGHIDRSPFSVVLDSSHESLGVLFHEEPISDPPIRTSPKQESDGYDFFDDLEELPMSLPFTSFMKNSFCDDRILVRPS